MPLTHLVTRRINHSQRDGTRFFHNNPIVDVKILASRGVRGAMTLSKIPCRLTFPSRSLVALSQSKNANILAFAIKERYQMRSGVSNHH